MTLFKNDTHQAIWMEHHCGRCYFGERACPILAKAQRTGRKPVEWERNTRKNALMQDSIKCNAETRSPPPDPRLVARSQSHMGGEDIPMFDVAAPIDMDTEHA